MNRGLVEYSQPVSIHYQSEVAKPNGDSRADKPMPTAGFEISNAFTAWPWVSTQVPIGVSQGFLAHSAGLARAKKNAWTTQK